MKKNNMLTIVFLLVLVVLGWTIQLTGKAADTKTHDTSVVLASEYEQKSLFQKAIAEYQKALAIAEDKLLRNEMVAAYKKAYADGVIDASDLTAALTDACGYYPEEAVYWEDLLGTYLDTNNYSDALKAYKKSAEAGASSDTLTEMSHQILYSFSANRQTYLEVCRSPLGYVTIRDEYGWKVIGPDGKSGNKGDYLYISPFNEDNLAVYVNDKGARLIGQDGVVEAIVSHPVTEAGAYGDGLLPVVTENGTWKYLDCYNDTFVAGEYEDASSFTGGTAAVKQNGGWTLIDKTGATVCDTVFDDIKLHGNKEYANRRVMIASVNGEYGIYVSNGQPASEFRCKQLDLYQGGYMAFQDETGKWGFVDLKGNVVIEPRFDEAKSFSNGLAGVRVGEQWGFVDTTGTLVIEPQFQDVGYFTAEGACFVSNLPDQYYVITLRFVGE